MLFSGDHVMQGSTVVIAPPDGDMALYLASLRRLLDLGPAARRRSRRATDRSSPTPPPPCRASSSTGAARERGGRRGPRRAGRATVDELLPTVYADVREELLPVAQQVVVGPPAQARRRGHGPRRRSGRHRAPWAAVVPPGRRRPLTSAAPARRAYEVSPSAASTRSSRRAVHPDTSTTGATSSAMRVARASKASPRTPGDSATGRAGVPDGGHVGVQRDGAHQGHADLGGEPRRRRRRRRARYDGAVVTGERRHVLDDARHPEMALARHVGGARRDLLRGDGRRGDDEHLGAREHAGQAHLDVAGPGGHVDEEVVELAPADVLEELLDGPVQDQARAT